MIKLRTVQHTGTVFFKQLLRKHGIKYNHKHLGRDDMPDLPGDIVLCTVRHPKTCYISTKSRGRYDKSFHQGYKELNEIWANHKYDPENTFFIPIDLPECRQQALDRLSQRIGVKLVTDWEPVSSRRHKPNIEPIDLSTEYKLPIIEAFYGTKSKAKAPKKAKTKTGQKRRKSVKKAKQ